MNTASRKQQKGFNLAEMMTTLAITSILSATAVPAFDSVIENSQLNAANSEMSSSLALARSEAITRNTNTVICKSSGSSCDTSNSADWSNGWIIFVDDNNNGIRDNAEELLYVNQTGFGKARVAGATLANNVRFRADGSVISSGNINVCASTEKGLSIAITPIGRTHSSKLDSASCSV